MKKPAASTTVKQRKKAKQLLRGLVLRRPAAAKKPAAKEVSPAAKEVSPVAEYSTPKLATSALASPPPIAASSATPGGSTPAATKAKPSAAPHVVPPKPRAPVKAGSMPTSSMPPLAGPPAKIPKRAKAGSTSLQQPPAAKNVSGSSQAEEEPANLSRRQCIYCRRQMEESRMLVNSVQEWRERAENLEVMLDQVCMESAVAKGVRMSPRPKSWS